MPVGIEVWRAGIVSSKLNYCLLSFKSYICFKDYIYLVTQCFAYLYLFTLLLLLSIPIFIHISSLRFFLQLIIGSETPHHQQYHTTLCFCRTSSVHSYSIFFIAYFLHCSAIFYSYCLFYLLEKFPLNKLLLLAGDIERNPGPPASNYLRFFIGI